CEHALLNHREGRSSAALQDILQASEASARLKDDRLEADILLAKGEILKGIDHAAALQALSKGLDLISITHYRLKAASLHLERGRILADSGDGAAAESAFTAGIEEIEHVRGSLDEQLRAPFLDQYLPLFEAMIGLLVDEQRFEEAFSYVELSRSRVL